MDRKFKGIMHYKDDYENELNSLVTVEELKKLLSKLTPMKADKLMFTFEDSLVELITQKMRVYYDNLIQYL